MFLSAAGLAYFRPGRWLPGTRGFWVFCPPPSPAPPGRGAVRTGVLPAAPLVNFAGSAALSGLGSLTTSPSVKFHIRHGPVRVRVADPGGSCQLHIRRGAFGHRTAHARRAGDPEFTPAVPLSGAGVLTVARRVSRAPGASLTGLGVLTATAQAGGTGRSTRTRCGLSPPAGTPQAGTRGGKPA